MNTIFILTLLAACTWEGNSWTPRSEKLIRTIPNVSYKPQQQTCFIGVSVSEPHIDEFAVYIYIVRCAINCLQLFTLHIIVSCINSKPIYKRVELKTRTINSLPPQWYHYLYCCLTHSCYIEVTQRWGLAHVEKGGESAPSVHAVSV